jgi:hypothetical protein
LTAFVFAADPIAEQNSLVRIALALDVFPILKTPALAVGCGGIGVNRFGAQVQFANAGNMGQIQAGPVAGPRGESAGDTSSCASESV